MQLLSLENGLATIGVILTAEGRELRSVAAGRTFTTMPVDIPVPFPAAVPGTGKMERGR